MNYKPALLILLLICTLCRAETAHEVATRIISRESPIAVNPPLHATDEERDMASAMNSRLILNSIMKSDDVFEKLRVCYAILLINEKLQIAPGIYRLDTPKTVLSDYQKQLRNDKLTLGNYLRALNR